MKAEGLTWTEVLPLLRELAEELEISLAEGTIPRRLSPEQVWIQPEGSVQLIDFLDTTPADPARGEITPILRCSGHESGSRFGLGNSDFDPG